VTSYEDNITSSHNITNSHFYNPKDYDFMYLFSRFYILIYILIYIIYNYIL